MSSAVIQPLSSILVLPWSPDEKQEESFKRLAKKVLIALLLLFIVIPWLPVFEQAYTPPPKKIIKTRVILESQQLTPPKPVVIKPKVLPKPKPKAVKPKKPQQNTAAKPKDAKTALSQSKGLSSLSRQLAALRGKANVAGIKNKKVSTNKKATVATVNRDILGENRATQASLNIDVDDNLMKGASVQLSEHETSNVEGLVSLGDTSSTGGSNYSYVSGLRDPDSIRRVIEQKKGLIYALYYDALASYPDLHGKFIFKMVIQPNGKIVQLALVSSELNLDELEQKMLNRIQLFNFGVEDVTSTPVEYRFVFVPS